MKVTVVQSCPTLCDPVDYTVHGILQIRILEWVVCPFSRGSSHPKDQTRSPALQADSLPAEPKGKPKNTAVSTLSFLQRIFQTQESNMGLLHCRWSLYQLSYQGSPKGVQKENKYTYGFTGIRHKRVLHLISTLHSPPLLISILDLNRAIRLGTHVQSLESM